MSFSVGDKVVGGCIEFVGCRNRKGYGVINRQINGKKGMFAHRFAWEQAYGPIPKNLCVLHKCDNPPCINLQHLFLGTRKDNTNDRKAKGGSLNSPYGSLCKHSKLTEETATYIMARLLAGESQYSIAKVFGVTKRTIWQLWHGITWRHVFKIEKETGE